MNDHWELWDVYKALMSVGAGLILGIEREMKDKVAGLKTITIITLGSALFAILSYKMGEGYDPTRIASYVVSGVGFIGAGAIFKEGFTISGLTTAGLIWLAAAVGLSIGFGEFFLAATFIMCWIFMLLLAPVINNIYRGKKLTRQLQVEIAKTDFKRKDSILESLRKEGIVAEQKQVTMKEDIIEVSIEIVTVQSKIEWVHNYLLAQAWIRSFAF